jgi:uncharacterized membrane protein SirB2
MVLFTIRYVWMIQESHWLQQRRVKFIPHMIDSLLLISGLALALILHQYPWTQTWLTAKLLALLFYIVMGSIALTVGKTKTIRITAGIAALIIFFYIITLALTRVVNPLASVGCVLRTCEALMP